MTHCTPRSHRFAHRLLAPLAVALLLAACDDPVRAPDYRKAYPLPVSKETVMLSVPASGAPLEGQDALAFERFMVDYHYRGRKTLVVDAGTGSDTETVRRLLVGAGVRDVDIALTAGSGETAPGRVVLSFAAHAVKVPDCGNFTSKTTPNWTNRRHANYGCATRRNLGLMVQDPKDLDQARPQGAGDGTQGVNMMNIYRSRPGTGQ